jgi:hypothetical protein
LRSIGRSQGASTFEKRAELCTATQRLPIVMTLTGYALFESGGVRHPLHPGAMTTGVLASR